MRRLNWCCEISFPISQEQLKRDFRNDGLMELISHDLIRFWTEGSGGCYCFAYMDLEAEDNQDLMAILNQEIDEIAGTCLDLVFEVQIFSPSKVISTWKGRLEPPDDAMRQDRIEDMNTRNRLGEWIPFFDYKTGQYIAVESKHVRKVPRVAIVNLMAGLDRIRDLEVIADSFDEFLDLWKKNAFRTTALGAFQCPESLVLSERMRTVVRSKYVP